MTKLQPELFSLEGAKRFIEKKIQEVPIDRTPNEIFHFKPDEKDEKYISLRYADLKRIDSLIQAGRIKKVQEAKRMRKIYISMILNYMVRNHVVDMNILQMEGLTIEELVEKYYKHIITTECIEGIFREHPELRAEIKRLAALGEPYSTKNGKEIALLGIKKEKIVWREYSGNLFRRYVTLGEIKHIEAEIEILAEDDELGGKYYPIENLCCSMVYKRHPEYRIEKEYPFGFWNLWYMTPTGLERLLGQMVKFYKTENSDAIKALRLKENQKRKNQHRRNKKLTTTEKKDMVQELKKQGLTYSQAFKQVEFSISTFKRHWK